MDRNLGFSASESGVGGTWVVEPMARVGLGGEVGRSVRRWLLSDRSSGKTYCIRSVRIVRRECSAHDVRIAWER